MAVTKLTSVGVKRLRPPAHGRADYADTILPGLHLRVTDKCHKSWSVVYRINGKQRRMTLGAYPTLDLIDARAAAREALQAVERGEDPIQLRHAGAPAAISTFGAVARSFIERYAKPRLATWAQTQSTLERHVLPQWGARPIADIAKRDVILLLDHVVEERRCAARRGGNVSAVDLLELLEPLLVALLVTHHFPPFRFDS